MTQDTSKLFKYLALMESDKQRVMAMHDRRRDTIETLLNEVNEKESDVVMISLGSELSEIYSEMFGLKYDEIKSSTLAPKRADIEIMNNLGFKSINYSGQVLDLIRKKEDKYLFAESEVTLVTNVAKIYSKLYDKEMIVQVKYYQQSLGQY